MTNNQKKHLNKIHLQKRAPYGRWKCLHCNQIFETRRQLQNHNCCLRAEKTANGFKCPYCSAIIENGRKLGGHMLNCKKHPAKQQHDLAHKKSGKTLSMRIKAGKLISGFKNMHHSEKSKDKIRKNTRAYLEIVKDAKCRYNKSSIKVLEQIAKEHGWNIQHAENGGEFYTGIGYWLDAYDKEKNVVLEYDEPAHYEDVENNILREKDLKRQNEIIEHLHCEYWRYNEKMKVLWKVC